MTLGLTIAAALLCSATSTTTPSSADDDVIIIIDDEPADDYGGDVIDLTDGDEISPDLFSIQARASAQLDVRVAIDTAFDRDQEQVAESLIDARLVLDVDLSKTLRAYAVPRFTWQGAVTRDGDDRELVLSGAPEAFLGWASGAISARAGYLIFDWGQSEIIGPSDVLNPPDLRRNPWNADSDLKIPVPGAEVVATYGALTIRGVVVPVFVPARFQLTGWDISALQGGVIPGGGEFADAEVVNPAFIDLVGDQAVQTERPRDRPDNATLGLRATLGLDLLDLGASIVYGWNPLPSMTVDPNLILLGSRVAEARSRGTTPPLDDPEIAGALLNLQRAFEVGAPIFKGKFDRHTVVGVDAALALDPFIIKMDIAYNSYQVSYSRSGLVRGAPTATAVFGAEYYLGEQLQVWLEVFAQRLFSVPGTDSIAFIEPDAPDRTPGRDLTWFGGGAFARYQLLDGDLGVELGVLVTSREDLALLPRLNYRMSEHHSVYLGMVMVQGQTDGLGGTYGHLDQAYFGYRASY